jgi:hypothetical protein
MYASESIWLSKVAGIPEIVVDLLIKNDSEKSVEDLYCVVPQRLFDEDGSLPQHPPFIDMTEDLVARDSRYSKGMWYEVHNTDNDTTELRLTLPHPQNSRKNSKIFGVFRGGNHVDTTEFTSEQRVLMNSCLFGVVRVSLGRAMFANEKRWFRWRISPFTGPQEHRNWLERRRCFLINNLTLTYSVSGPEQVQLDVKKKMIDLRQVISDGDFGSTEDQGWALNNLNDLLEKLVFDGREHPDTNVHIEDWRTRFFRAPMEPFVVSQEDGAVRVVGGQPNYILPDVLNPQYAEYYEWASGCRQIPRLPPGLVHGAFTIRFSTKFIPLLHRIGPIVAFTALVLATISLILRFSTE